MSEETPGRSPVSESQRLIARHHSLHTRRYAKAVCLILLSVAAGAVIGVGGTVIYFDRKLHRVPPQPDAIATAIMSRLHSLMPIEAGEDASLTETVHRRMREVESIRRDSYERIRDVFHSMDEDIAAIVGDQRAEKWQEYKRKRKMDKRQRHGRSGGGRGPGGHGH